MKFMTKATPEKEAFVLHGPDLFLLAALLQYLFVGVPDH